MDKDLFDYIVNPTSNEYRKPNIIDKIAWIPKLTIPNILSNIAVKEQFVNDAIINYNNEAVVLKTFYANMIKYKKYYDKKKTKEYDTWSRKYAEQVIKELFSIYDKSFHIINYLYNFKVAFDIDFKSNIREKLKQEDKKFYNKINSVFSRLYGDISKRDIRDDITHNFSSLFQKYIPKYNQGKIVGWDEIESLSYDEFKLIIDNICELLIEQKQLIIDKIADFYPQKI